MKNIQNTGLGIFLIGLTLFISLIFLGKYELTPTLFKQIVKDKGIKSELFINEIGVGLKSNTIH